MPHEITQCYLPPGKNDIPALVCLTYSCAGTACVCVCGKCKLRVSSCVRAGLQADRQTDRHTTLCTARTLIVKTRGAVYCAPGDAVDCVRGEDGE